MKIISASLLCILLAGCFGRKNESVVSLPDGFHKSSDVSSTVRIVSGDVQSDSTAMKRAAPEPVLLPPEALREVFKPVFGEQPRKNPALFFSAAESDDLGGYRILTANNPRAGSTQANPSMIWLRNLSADYVFTLRQFAADACEKLIDSELANAKNPDNKLVEGESPSQVRINTFLTTLLGYQEKEKLHAGVDTYHAAFEKMRTATPLPQNDADKAARLKSAYNHLCAALVTDVRVYYR
ncbi:MAG: hypothetical protein RLZZ488_1075 [Pseudomonadota bacterium]|jgi:hypothetical protein